MTTNLTNTHYLVVAAVALMAAVGGHNPILWAVLALVAMVGHGRGWWVAAATAMQPRLVALAAWVRRLLVRPPAEKTTAVYELYDVLLGYNPTTGRPDVENLQQLGHIGVFGTTRYGKTTWLHSVLHHLIGQHSPAELRVAISDPKTVDYSIWSGLAHLMCPIARDMEETERMVNLLVAEMDYRSTLFGKYGRSRLCNNLELYTEISGERLPRIVAVFDELADVVEAGSALESQLFRLAKKGIAYGIHLICATQRPSSKVISGELKSQMGTKVVTWMSSNREYGVVAELPQELYKDMPRERGRFMIYSAGGWRFMQGRKVPNRQLEQLAARRAGRLREWSTDAHSVAVISATEWGGSDMDKVRLLQMYASDLGRRPSITETMERFSIARATAVKYRKLAFDEVVETV